MLTSQCAIVHSAQIVRPIAPLHVRRTGSPVPIQILRSHTQVDNAQCKISCFSVTLFLTPPSEGTCCDINLYTAEN